MGKTISLKLLLICIIFFSSISIAIITALILYFAGRSSLQAAIELYSDLTIQVAVQNTERKLNNTYVAVSTILNFTTRKVPDLYASDFTLSTALTQAAKNRFLVNDNWATAFVAVSCRYSNGDGLFHRFVSPTAYAFTGTSNVAFWSGPTTTPGVDVILNQSRDAFNVTSLLPVPVVPWPNFGSVSSTFVRGTLWNSSAARTPSQPQLVELPPTFASAGILGTQTPIIYDMSIAGVRNSSIPLSPLTATSFCSMLIFLDELVLDLMASFGSLTTEVKAGGLRSVFLVDTVTERVISHSLGTSSHFVINKTNSGFPLGFVPFNCISSANFIGCFYNISTYAPYADLKNAIDAGLSINSTLRPHEVRQVELEDDQIIAFVTPVSLRSKRFRLKMYLTISSSYFTKDLDVSLQFALGLSIGVAAVISIVGGYIGLKIALSDVEELSLRMQQDPWRTDDDDRVESSEEATNSSGSAREGKIGDKNLPISSDDEQNVLGKDEGKNNSSTEKSKTSRQDAKKAKKTKDSSTTSSSSFASSLYCVLDETAQLRKQFNNFRSFIHKIRGFMLASGSRHVAENPGKIFGIFDPASPTNSDKKNENEKSKTSTQNNSNSAVEFGDEMAASSATVNEAKGNDESNTKRDSFLGDPDLEEESNKMPLEEQQRLQEGDEEGDNKPKKKKKALTFNFDPLQEGDAKNGNEAIEGENENAETTANATNDENDNTEDDTASNLNNNNQQSVTATSSRLAIRKTSAKLLSATSSPLAPPVKGTTSAFSQYVQAHGAKSRTKMITELFMVVHVKFMIIKKFKNSTKNHINNNSTNTNASAGMKTNLSDQSQGENTKEIAGTTASTMTGSSFAVSIYQINKRLEQEKVAAESSKVQEVVDLDGNVVVKKKNEFPMVILKRTSPGVSAGSYAMKTKNSDTTEVAASAMNQNQNKNKFIEPQNGLVDVSGYFELVDVATDSTPTSSKTPGCSTEDVEDDAAQDHFVCSRSTVTSASVQLKQRTGKLIAKASDAIISHSGLSLVEFFGDSMLGCYRIKSLERRSLMTARLITVLDLVQQWLATDDCETTSPSDFINEKLAQLAKAADRNDNRESPTAVDEGTDQVKLDQAEVLRKTKVNKKHNKKGQSNNSTSSSASSVPPLPFSLKICASLVPGRLGLLTSDELAGFSAAAESDRSTSKPLGRSVSISSSINNLSGGAAATTSLLDLNSKSNNQNNDNLNSNDKNLHPQRAVTFLGPAVSLSKNIADQSPIGFLNRAEDMMRDFLASGIEAKRRENTKRKGAKDSRNSQRVETASFSRVRSRLRKRMFADLELKRNSLNVANGDDVSSSSPAAVVKDEKRGIGRADAEKKNNPVDRGSPTNIQRSRGKRAHDDEIFDYLDLKCVNSTIPFIVLPSNAFALVSERCEVVSMASMLLRGSSGGNTDLSKSKDKKNAVNRNNNNNTTESDGKNRKNNNNSKQENGSSNFGVRRLRRNTNADDDDNKSSTSTSSEIDESDNNEKSDVEKNKKRRLKYLESIKTSIVRILPKECTALIEESH